MIKFLNKVLLTINGTDITLNYLLFSLIIPIISIMIIAFVLKKIAILLYREMKKAEKKALGNFDEKKTNKKRERALQKIGLQKIKKIIRVLEIFSIILILFSFISNTFPLKNVFSVFTAPLYSSGNTKISFVSIVLLFIIIYFANIASFQLKKIIKLFLSYNPKFSKNSIEVIANISRYATLMMVFFIGLPLVGIDISSFVVLLSALGLGIGFGLQDTIANYAAGITINLTHIIKEGDRVVVKDIEGIVQRISLLNTVIRSVTLEELIVPNKFIINEPMQNLSHTDKHFLVSCVIQVSYETDLEQVEKIILSECKALPYLYKGELFFRVSSFDDSGITVRVVAHIKDVSQKFVAKSDLNMMVWKIFKKHNIDIPFPQLDLHVKDIADTKKRITQKNKKNVVRASVKQRKK